MEAGRGMAAPGGIGQDDRMSRVSNRSALAAALVLGALAVTCPPPVPASETVPQVVLVVDESGSMTGRQQWLADALPALARALDEQNVDSLTNDVEFTLTGFAVESRELVQRASDYDASRSVAFLRTDRGGVEDGYAALRDVLGRHPEYADTPTTIILVTDEDRDAHDPGVTMESLVDELVAKRIVLHALTLTRIRCPDGGQGIALRKDGTALTPGNDGLASCANAEGRTFDAYSELAWATGGVVFSLDAVAPRHKRFDTAPLADEIIAELAGHIVAQWPSGPAWAQVDYWPRPARVGDAVTFDGSASFTTEPDRQVVAWEWDFDGDGAGDETGAVVAKVFSTPGRQRVVLTVRDDSEPAAVGHKVIHLDVEAL